MSEERDDQVVISLVEAKFEVWKKEFIMRLKEDLHEKYMNNYSVNHNSLNWNDIKWKIDELAGEKLIVPQGVEKSNTMNPEGVDSPQENHKRLGQTHSAGSSKDAHPTDDVCENCGKTKIKHSPYELYCDSYINNDFRKFKPKTFAMEILDKSKEVGGDGN